MTPWFRLILVCSVLLCLLLGLTQAVGWNYQPVASSGSLFDRGTKATSDSPTSSVVGSMVFDSARAGPFGSLVLDRELTAGNTGPPGQENYGAIATDRPWQVAGQPGQLKPTPSSNLVHEITGFQPNNSRIGVSQHPLARTLSLVLRREDLRQSHTACRPEH